MRDEKPEVCASRGLTEEGLLSAQLQMGQLAVSNTHTLLMLTALRDWAIESCVLHPQLSLPQQFSYLPLMAYCLPQLRFT